MSDLQPTHTCFDDAIEMAIQLVTQVICKHPSELIRTLRFNDVRICHAECRMTDGTLYSHAWLEFEGKALEAAFLNGKKVRVEVSVEEQRKRLDILHITTYNLEQAKKLSVQYQNTGPWVKRYKNLCSDKRIVEVN